MPWNSSRLCPPALACVPRRRPPPRHLEPRRQRPKAARTSPRFSPRRQPPSGCPSRPGPPWTTCRTGRPPPGPWFASAIVHLGYFNCLMAGYRAADPHPSFTLLHAVARRCSQPLCRRLFGEHLWLALAPRPGGCGGWHRADDRRLRSSANRMTPRRPWARRRRAGVWWGLATGSLIAGYPVIDAYAVKAVLLVSPCCSTTSAMCCAPC